MLGLSSGEVKIFIPVFNAAKTIESVLQRSFEFVKPEHVVVVDDGSSDGSLAILQELAREQDTVMVTLFNGQPLAVTPPNHVELEIVETDPGLKGDTAQGGSKPATLSTGAVVNVPLFITIGEVLKVDTRTGEYVNRVKSS